jgi:hypothetical protein
MPLSYDALKQLWIQAGGPPGAADTAAAITIPESGGNPGSIQQGQPYATTGWGLWQITPGNSVPNVGINNALLDPLTNARAAVAKFVAAGNSFRPWTTFTSGAYKKFLQGADWPGGATTVGSTTQATPAGFWQWLGNLGNLLWKPLDMNSLGSAAGATGGIVDGISGIVTDLSEFFNDISLLFKPQFWLRVGAFFMGALLLIGGAFALIGVVKA